MLRSENKTVHVHSWYLNHTTDVLKMLVEKNPMNANWNVIHVQVNFEKCYETLKHAAEALSTIPLGDF